MNKKTWKVNGWTPMIVTIIPQTTPGNGLSAVTTRGTCHWIFQLIHSRLSGCHPLTSTMPYHGFGSHPLTHHLGHPDPANCFLLYLHHTSSSHCLCITFAILTVFHDICKFTFIWFERSHGWLDVKCCICSTLVACIQLVDWCIPVTEYHVVYYSCWMNTMSVLFCIDSTDGQ